MCLRRKVKLDEALNAYRGQLANMQRLVAVDRSNMQWQRDLSISYIKVGDVLMDEDKLDEAIAAYRDSLAICERLVAADNGNTLWESDLSLSYGRVGMC